MMIEQLPLDLHALILSFVPIDWLKLCSHQHYLDFLDTKKELMVLCEWIRFKQKEVKYRKQLTLTKRARDLFSQSEPLFQNYRDLEIFLQQQEDYDQDCLNLSRLVQFFHNKAMSHKTKLQNYFPLYKINLLNSMIM